MTLVLPRHLEQKYGPTMQLWKRRILALMDARRILGRHIRDIEYKQGKRNSLLMSLEDPYETVLSKGDDQYFDTDVIHGAMQRVHVSQVYPMVYPVLTSFHREHIFLIQKEKLVQLFLYDVAGCTIVRVARGFRDRKRVRELRQYLLLEAAAVLIQAAWKGYFVRRYILPVYIANFRSRKAMVLQKFARGLFARQWYLRMREHHVRLARDIASVRIQSATRCWSVYKNRDEWWGNARKETADYEKEKQRKLERAKKRRRAKEHRAATEIQRLFRGMLGRREVYIRRQQGFLSHPRMRALADAFLQNGDVWGLLSQVNAEMEKYDRSQRQSEIQKRTFIKQLVNVSKQNRVGEEKYNWRKWENAKANFMNESKTDKNHLSDTDSKLMLLEQLYIQSPDSSQKKLQARTFMPDPRNSLFLREKEQEETEQEETRQGKQPEFRNYESVMGPEGDSEDEETKEHERYLNITHGPPIGREHLKTAHKQKLYRPIDGSHPCDALLPPELSKSLADPAQQQRIEERTIKDKATLPPITPYSVPQPKKTYKGHLEFTIKPNEKQSGQMYSQSQRRQTSPGFSAPSLSPMVTETKHNESEWRSEDERIGQEGLHESPTFKDESLLTSSIGMDAEQQQFGSAPLERSSLVPGGAILDSSGNIRSVVLAGILKQVDRLTTRNIVRERGPGDKPLDPATKLMLERRERLEEERRLKLLEYANESLEPRAETATLEETEKKLEEDGEGGHKGDDHDQYNTRPITEGRPLTEDKIERDYQEVKSKLIWENARMVSKCFVEAYAETIESLLVRERMDNDLGMAVVSGNTPAGTGPEGYTKLVRSGLINRATEYSKKNAIEHQRKQRILQEQATLSDVSMKQLQQLGTVPSSWRGSLTQIPSLKSSAKKSLTDSSYHLTHGRDELTNPADPMWSESQDQHKLLGNEESQPSLENSQKEVTDVSYLQDANLRDDVKNTVSKEKLLHANGVKRVDMKTLLRDVRGLNGPLDMLVLHAALRLIPIPQGCLTWAKCAGVPLSKTLVSLSENGQPLITSTGDPRPVQSSKKKKKASKKAAKIKEKVVIAPEYNHETAGEEAAKVFNEFPAGLAKLQWEEVLRKEAEPVIEQLRHYGCRVAGDVADIDLSKTNIEPRFVYSLRRLLRVLKTAEQLSNPGVVRDVYQTNPEPVKPPLMGLYAVPQNQSRIGTASGSHVMTQSSHRQASPIRAENSALVTFGSSSENMNPKMALSVGRSFNHEELNMKHSSLDHVPVGLGNPEAPPPLEGQSTIIRGQKPDHPSVSMEKDITHMKPEVFIQPGLFTGYGAGYGAASTGANPKELNHIVRQAAKVALATGDFHFPRNANFFWSIKPTEGELLSEIYHKQARELSRKLSKFLGMSAIPGKYEIVSKIGEVDDDVNIDVLVLPLGFSILRRDQWLTANSLRAIMLTRLKKQTIAAEIEESASEKSEPRSMIVARSNIFQKADERREHLASLRAEEESKIEEAKRSVFQQYYTKLLEGKNPSSLLDEEKKLKDELEISMVEQLNFLHTSLNGLKSIESLEDGIEPALVQVAFVLPIPSPHLVEIADYRTGIMRTPTDRLRVCVPYDLFLRTLIAYNLPDDESKPQKVADHRGVKKQRMLIRERVRSARMVADPWIRALQRWGYSRLGQLLKVPHHIYTRIFRTAYPVTPFPGATSLEKHCLKLANSVDPHNVGASLISALENWSHSNEETMHKLTNHLKRFDSRYQKGPTDHTGRGALSRELSLNRKQARQLGSPNWRTFETQNAQKLTWLRDSEENQRITASSKVQRTDRSNTRETNRQEAVQQEDSQALVSPMWFGDKETFASRRDVSQDRIPRAEEADSINPRDSSESTLHFVENLWDDQEPEKLDAHKIDGGVGGLVIDQKAHGLKKPQFPQSVIKSRHSRL